MSDEERKPYAARFDPDWDLALWLVRQMRRRCDRDLVTAQLRLMAELDPDEREKREAHLASARRKRAASGALFTLVTERIARAETEAGNEPG